MEMSISYRIRAQIQENGNIPRNKGGYRENIEAIMRTNIAKQLIQHCLLLLLGAEIPLAQFIQGELYQDR